MLDKLIEVCEDEAMTDHPFPDGCQWLVEAPSNNPEPDSPADCYVIVPCGADVTMLEDGWECSVGHYHVEYGSSRQQAMEAMEAMAERY